MPLHYETLKVFEFENNSKSRDLKYKWFDALKNF